MILQDQYWYSIWPTAAGPSGDAITGKWLVFGPTEELHALLPRLNELIESGALRGAKVARKLPGIDPFPDAPCVVCAYTSDDAAEKERIKQRLIEEFSFDVSIWKSDEQTRKDWNEGGWLRVRSEITDIRRVLASSRPGAEINAAKDRLKKLTNELKNTLRTQPEQLTEAQYSGLRDAAAALQESTLGGRNDDIAARVLVLEKQLDGVVARLKQVKADAPDEVALNSVFVIMPFSDKQIDTYDAIQRAVRKADSNLTAARVDEKPGAIAITDEIHSSIRTASLVICDLTEERPNVYYELGFARGIGRPLICIARAGTTIHFDVYGLKIIFFETYRALEERLASEVAALMRSAAGARHAMQAKE